MVLEMLDKMFQLQVEVRADSWVENCGCLIEPRLELCHEFKYCIATTICSRHASQALILNKFLAMSHSRGHCEQAPEQCVTEKCQIWIF